MAYELFDPKDRSPQGVVALSIRPYKSGGRQEHRTFLTAATMHALFGSSKDRGCDLLFDPETKRLAVRPGKVCRAGANGALAAIGPCIVRRGAKLQKAFFRGTPEPNLGKNAISFDLSSLFGGQPAAPICEACAAKDAEIAAERAGSAVAKREIEQLRAERSRLESEVAKWKLNASVWEGSYRDISAAFRMDAAPTADPVTECRCNVLSDDCAQCPDESDQEEQSPAQVEEPQGEQPSGWRSIHPAMTETKRAKILELHAKGKTASQIMGYVAPLKKADILALLEAEGLTDNPTAKAGVVAPRTAREMQVVTQEPWRPTNPSVADVQGSEVNRPEVERMVGHPPIFQVPPAKVCKLVRIMSAPGHRSPAELAEEVGVVPALLDQLRIAYDPWIRLYSVLARPAAKAYFLEVLERRLKGEEVKSQ